MLKNEFESKILGNYYLNKLDIYLETNKHNLNTKSILVKMNLVELFKENITKFISNALLTSVKSSEIITKDLISLTCQELLEIVSELNELTKAFKISINPFENDKVRNVEFKLAYSLTKIKNIQLYLYSLKDNDLTEFLELATQLYYNLEKMI